MTINIHDKSNKTYVVLGAPGAATSFVTKCLMKGGVNMRGENDRRFNTFYENSDFVNLNIDILREAGGGGANPPSEKDILEVKADSRIKKLINKYKGRFWGWKDPKTSLTIKKYLPHLKDDVYLICCFRRPKYILEKYRWYRRRDDNDNKNILDRHNRDIISGIKEFCEL